MAKYMVLFKSDDGEVLTYFFTRYEDAKEMLSSGTCCMGWWGQLYEWGPADPDDPESPEAYVLLEE